MSDNIQGVYMQKWSNNSNSVIIVLHEIYGINQHIKSVCEHYFMAGYDIICPNYINLSQAFSYDQEEAAYRHFTTNIGFEMAYHQVKELAMQFRTQYKNVFLLGFSIGATTAWICSGDDVCDGVIGYYGSRIRDYLSITPKCPVLLIFPTEEKSFDVQKLVCEFEKNINVKINVLNGKHGFSDPFSRNFDEQSYLEAEKSADNFIKQICDTVEVTT